MPRLPSLRIRWPVRNDLEKLTDIYNQAIRAGNATGHTKEFTKQARWSWYKSHTKYDFPIYVLEHFKEVIGYGTLSPYRSGRQAMESIAEVSFFLDKEYQRKGFGTVLLGYIIQDCERVKKKTLLAILLDNNIGSLRLLKKYGFRKWGHFPKVVEFKDKICSQVIYGLKIKDVDRSLINEQLIRLGYVD